jgi:hypothetical protein
MLRGAIDLVHETKVGGWIYSPVREIRDQTILAYIDERCVGSGKVQFVREDLKAAGLGDGLCGFSFPIAAKNVDDLHRVVVKLQGSDLVLLQPGATIAKTELYQPVFANLERLEWLRKKGLLDPAEFTFLKYLQQMSVFDFSLVTPKSANLTKGEGLDPAKTAQSSFDLLGLRRVDIKELEISPQSAEELALAVLGACAKPMSIVALHASQAGEIAVVEGSHLEETRPAGFEGAIDYQYGPDRLLFIDLNARFQFPEGKSPRLRVFAAC